MLRVCRVGPALLVCGMVVLVGGCREAAPPAVAPPQARPVDIVQVTTSDLPVEFEFVGRTESSQRVEIRARVAGYLDAIDYEEGAFVDEGDVLFHIDPQPFEARLRASNAELAQQTARLENAQALLDRITPLAEVDAVAQKELDDARSKVREAAAAVEAASAHVYEAELNLGYTTISSPVRGLTSSSSQREGSYISGVAGALTYVAKIDPMWVEFCVSETQLLRATRQRESGGVAYPETSEFEVVLLLADGTEHGHAGRISFRDASVSTETGTVLVRAEVPNPEETLRPGQYVRVYVRGAHRPDAVTVPQRSVFEGPRGAFVWVVNADSQAEQRPVRMGPWVGDRWVVEQGLKVGDRVVVNGTVGMAPGTPLTIASIVREDGQTEATNLPAGGRGAGR